MTDTTPNHCLFFDANGNGPSEIRLIDREIREHVENGEVIVPRAFGLCWEVVGPLHFVEAGGFMLDTERVTWLRDRLTTWLDAPRLAARETAAVVASTVDYALVTTTAGEWGVTWRDNEDDLADGDTEWFASEILARSDFREATGTTCCELCGTYRDDHDVDEDGIHTCTDEHKAACEAACATKQKAKCQDNSPAGFAGHWRDWHRGHGCDKDPDANRKDVTP